MNGKIKNNIVRPKWMIPVAIAAIVFGLATIISGGKSLFTEVGSVAAGNYVAFVLWFNFIAGFAYIAAGVGLAKDLAWSRPLALSIAATTCVVFAFFGIHILQDGAFENRTVAAMVLRSGFWLVVGALSHFRFKKGFSV